MSDTRDITQKEETAPTHLSEMVGNVCEKVKNGQTVSQASRILGYEPGAIYTAAYKYPELKQMLEEAHEIFTEVAVDDLASLPDSGMNPQIMQTHSNNVKWTAARRNRRQFGDNAARITDNSTGLVDVLKEAIERIPRPNQDIKTIDHD